MEDKIKNQAWNRSSLLILSTFLLIIGLIAYIWWPLLKDYLASYRSDVPFWLQIDWLLIILFLVMSILIMTYANIKTDTLLVVIALVGGYVIEFWGTQTGLWTYYTYERPPLWIIPAWPIAFLSVNRLVHYVTLLKLRNFNRLYFVLYWVTFPLFFVFLVFFSFITVSNILTISVIILCAFLIIINPDKQSAVLYFYLGSALGYFLELWGTTRECWTYYTGGTPPLFTVFAHGFATVSIWLAYTLLTNAVKQLKRAKPLTNRR